VVIEGFSSDRQLLSEDGNVALNDGTYPRRNEPNKGMGQL
jgi:hypothetical protein